MRILIIATTKFDVDGITNVIMNYYRAIDKSDMQIDFVVINKVNNNLKNEIDGNLGKIYELLMRNTSPFEYLKQLSQIIRKGKYDIVHAHGNSCTLAVEMYSAKKGGAKVRIPHSHNSTCEHLIIHRILRRLFDINYTNAFACGEKAGKWLYNNKPFTVINNGVDVDCFKYNHKVREEYREKYKLSDNKVVGHIGRFAYQKNHKFLIEIFNRLYKLDNNYRLLLIGDGDLKQDIKQQISNLCLDDVVIFMGKSSEVPQLLQAIDIIVMPSRFEGLPLSLVEAQSACVPCFVSDAVSKEAAITELVQFISLEKSSKEWAEKIITTLPINREKIKNAVYSEIADAGYSILDNAQNLKKMYLDFLNNNLGVEYEKSYTGH